MRAQKSYADELKRKALAMHANGAKPSEIRDALNVHRNTLRDWVIRSQRSIAPPMTNSAKADRANMTMRLAEISVSLPSVAGRRYSYVHGALVVEEMRG